MLKEVEEIHKILDKLIDSFRLILNKYIDLLEEVDEYYFENKNWKEAMEIISQWFE